MYKLNLAGKKFTLFTCFILLCFSNNSNAQGKGIQFNNYSWQKLVEQAKSENKLIFVDCYTTWCGPCKYLAQNIFPMPQMGNYFNPNFISVSYDMEKEPGITLKKRFGITAYPTLLILNPRGFKLDQLLGNPNVDTLLAADSLIRWAKKSAGHFAPTSEENFDQGNRNAATINQYISSLILNDELLKAQDVLHNAIAKEGLSATLNPKYWNVIGIMDPNSVETAYIIKNKKQFYNKYGIEQVNAKLAAIFTAYYQLNQLDIPPPVRKINIPVYEAYLKNISNQNLENYSSIKNIIDFYLACKNYRLAEAQKLCGDILGKSPGWEYYRIAKMANGLIYNQAERNHYADWITAAAKFIDHPDSKSACLTMAASLAKPYQDNATHSHFELPDFN